MTQYYQGDIKGSVAGAIIVGWSGVPLLAVSFSQSHVLASIPKINSFIV